MTTARDRPDLRARIFKIKMDELYNDLMEKNALGLVIGWILVKEDQKRGLPVSYSHGFTMISSRLE